MRRRNSSLSIGPRRLTPDALAALKKAGFSRRDFLRGSGVLIVGFGTTCRSGKLGALSLPVRDPPGAPLDQVDSWIAIAQDERITGYTGKCEFGQGFRTVQYQLIAEELDVPLSRIKLIVCDTALTPDQGTTSGSQSHPAEFGPTGLRQAVATAREALFQMASDRFGVPVDQLAVQEGVIFVKGDPSQRASYGQLIGGKPFHLMVNRKARPKDPSQYTVLGTSVPRYEIPQKMTGEFQFVAHVRLPGMLHGRVVRPPSVGARLVSVDEGSVAHLPGNVRVVVRRDFVGVVADKEWQAIQAVEVLKTSWTDGAPLPRQEDLFDYMRQQPSRDSYTVLADDVDERLGEAAHVLKATYQLPYQMHGSIGGSSAVAEVQGTGSTARATLWSATQGVYPQRDSVALLLGIPRENVRVIFVEGTGCYGLNGADAVSYDAALLSQAVGRPVRVQLTRQDEMAWGENFGPAHSIDLRAGLNEAGEIIVWEYEGWTLSKGNRPNATTPGNIITGALAGFPTPPVIPGGGGPPTQYNNNGNADSSYGAGCVRGSCRGTGTVRSERILTHTIASPFFTGPLRSPARLQNTFANESFIDELAAFVRADPIEYRLRHLTDPRLIDVLKAAANAANWDRRPSPKPGNATSGIATGRGAACVLYEGNNGYVAAVAEVRVDQSTGDLAVTRLAISQDSGPISNPDGLRNQIEGGALQALSRLLREEVTWDEHNITSIDWRSYPVFRFGEPLPVVETVLINRLDQRQMGAGECSITVVGAAVANAVFDATGARIRQVPFSAARVLAALKARKAPLPPKRRPGQRRPKRSQAEPFDDADA